MHPFGIAKSDTANKILNTQNNFVIIYCSPQLLTSPLSNFFPDDGGSQFFLNSVSVHQLHAGKPEAASAVSGS